MILFGGPLGSFGVYTSITEALDHQEEYFLPEHAYLHQVFKTQRCNDMLVVCRWHIMLHYTWEIVRVSDSLPNHKITQNRHFQCNAALIVSTNLIVSESKVVLLRNLVHSNDYLLLYLTTGNWTLTANMIHDRVVTPFTDICIEVYYHHTNIKVRMTTTITLREMKPSVLHTQCVVVRSPMEPSNSTLSCYALPNLLVNWLVHGAQRYRLIPCWLVEPTLCTFCVCGMHKDMSLVRALPVFLQVES